ncbi:PepSY domain-containing protein [uncultured Roseovarius sp.]|uniref:PepSY-associated TM helix domain-containing protein n=1 Tax=uncultured Roseovarius sp. TaxID=293344 RepID=UPI0026146B34|nr:PepSY domain-containing protein [uncultured Roseovarius sp.]
MVSIDSNAVTADVTDTQDNTKFYKAAWRWHFYAGLYIIPFFMLLAVTGMFMLWLAYLDGRDGERFPVTPDGEVLVVSQLADVAVAAVPGGELKTYMSPYRPDMAAVFRVDLAGDANMVTINPYDAEVLQIYPRRSGWYDFMDNLHSDLMLGVTGDRMIEIAASLGMVLIATGLYMWWPRKGNWRQALFPTLGRGRSMWKSLHGAGGFWISIILAFFLVSGLAWTGVWGEKLTQAWSQFPAEKWDAPLSDKTHASLNGGRKEVPWALELTPLPESDPHAGHGAIDTGAVGTTTEAGAEVVPGPAPTLTSMDALAREIGFAGRYQLSLPQGETGVWTFSRDSMSNDSPDPTSDRTVHVDRYTGKVLADIRYEDYSLAGKAMAVGIALHMGTLGLWSVLANTLFCLTVIFLCLSAVVMWWMRRPAKTARLAAPPLPASMPFWKGAVLVGLLVSMAFPMAGITLLTVMLLDFLIISRVPGLQRLVS